MNFNLKSLMSNDPGEAPSDDFLEQIFRYQSYAAEVGDDLVRTEALSLVMMLQLGSAHLPGAGIGSGYGVGGGFLLGLSLEQGNLGLNIASGSSGNRFHHDDVANPRVAAMKGELVEKITELRERYPVYVNDCFTRGSLFDRVHSGNQ